MFCVTLMRWQSLRKACRISAQTFCNFVLMLAHGILQNENSWMKHTDLQRGWSHRSQSSGLTWLTHIDMFGGDRCADFRFIAALWESNAASNG